MIVIGTGSGMFFPPNNKSIMEAVPVERRGIAGGVRTMINNVGMVISMALSMAVITSCLTPEAFSGLIYRNSSRVKRHCREGIYFRAENTIYSIICDKRFGGIYFLSQGQPA